MILHTVNKPVALEKCRHFLAPEDVLLLIEDGVELAMPGQLPDEFRLCRIMALQADTLARGLQGRTGDIEIIDYDGFVRLSAEASKVCAWY